MDTARSYQTRAARELVEVERLDQLAERAGSDRARLYYRRAASDAAHRRQILASQAQRAAASQRILDQLDEARTWADRESGWRVVSPTAERTARSFHPCDECDGDIPPGELYSTTTYRSPEGLTTWRTCPHCGDGRTTQNPSGEMSERDRRGGVSE